jgi:serine/threonine protein kinase
MGVPVQPVAVSPSADLSSLVGKKVHHYSVVRELARGNTGTVFFAKHDEDGRELALKVLWPELCRDDEQMQRFIRAMKTMLPVKHDNIVRIYNAGKAGPHYWVAMEYVDGESLTQVIERIGLGGMLDWHSASPRTSAGRWRRRTSTRSFTATSRRRISCCGGATRRPNSAT